MQAVAVRPRCIVYVSPNGIRWVRAVAARAHLEYLPPHHHQPWAEESGGANGTPRGT